jgi:hypothetical protein
VAHHGARRLELAERITRRDAVELRVTEGAGEDSLGRDGERRPRVRALDHRAQRDGKVLADAAGEEFVRGCHRVTR